MYAWKGVHLYICMDDLACMYASHMAIYLIYTIQTEQKTAEPNVMEDCKCNGGGGDSKRNAGL